MCPSDGCVVRRIGYPPRLHTAGILSRLQNRTSPVVTMGEVKSENRQETTLRKSPAIIVEGYTETDSRLTFAGRRQPKGSMISTPAFSKSGRLWVTMIKP